MERPRHILVVDDDGDVGDVISRMLEECGYRCTAASGGVAMRDKLELNDVDCIILDAMMPGERSASLALHAKSLSLPVVMISGSHEMMTFAEGNGLQLLRKPFRAPELYRALQKAFDSGEFGQRG